MDDDIDVDGDDDATFGEPQFTENDIVTLPNPHAPDAEDSDVDVDVGGTTVPRYNGTEEREKDSQPEKTLHDLMAERSITRRQTEGVENVERMMDKVMGVGETEQAEIAVENARRGGDMGALVRALESQINLMVSDN